MSAAPLSLDAAAQTRLERTLPGRLAVHAARRPHAVALREKKLGIWREYGWADYYQSVAAAGRELHELGVREGDHVCILSDNRPEWLYADLAAQGIGARSVGIYQTNPPDDVAYIVNHCAAKVIVCEDQEQTDKVIEIAGDTPGLEHVVVIDPRGTRDYDDPRLISWREFIESGMALVEGEPGWFLERLQECDPDRPSMVVYTSGTTGRPKGAMLSSANVVDTAIENAKLLEVGEKDFVISYLPLCHVAEKIFSVFLPLATGQIVHFGESISTIQEDLREVSPTVFLGVPRIWEKMHAGVIVKMQDAGRLKRALYNYWTRKGREIAARKLAGANYPWDKLVWLIGDILVFRPLQERLGLRRCRLPVSGAAPISRDLLMWFHGIGVPIYEGYGQTECAGISHLTPPGKARLGTVGQAMPLSECKLDDDGEILTRGRHVFAGYLHDPEETAVAIDEDGWLHTGDIGSIDEAGYLSITGRKKEIIITSGGKNLSPEKIENALKTSPYIKEAVAIGDGRKFISALIQIEYDTVGNWATRRKLPFTSFGDLAGKDDIRKLIAGEVENANALLARVEQVRKFELLRKELHQDDGELTATQKVRRKSVMSIYADIIESIYGGNAVRTGD